MRNKMKRLPLIRIGIITLISYSATLIIYFKYYYKPLKLMDISGFEGEGGFYDSLVETNKLFKTMNREDILFFCIISLFMCLAVSIVISLIHEEIVLYRKPIISVNARLKLKDSVMRMCGDYTGFSAAGYNYNLTFETDDGIEMNFPVIPKQYMIVCEGNKGILKYKQGVFNRFVSFDIKEIE
jgi:hypothetical protein